MMPQTEEKRLISHAESPPLTCLFLCEFALLAFSCIFLQ
jgi:hypothetical protein